MGNNNLKLLLSTSENFQIRTIDKNKSVPSTSEDIH